MELAYLDFDVSEEADGSAVFDAMASVAAERLPALWAEVAAVLAWAHEAFAGARAPLDEGGEWDYLLDGAVEVRTPQVLVYDEREGRLSAVAGAAGAPRYSLSFSITGTAGFCEIFRELVGV